MSPPTVTVCVPSIGRVAYIPFVRASLAAQTLDDLEILVLDNASGPEARDLFADWARDDHRVRVARVDARIPMFTNFERGRRAARGEFLAFCHDDDVYLPRWLEEHVGALRRAPDAAFAGSNFDFVDERGRVTERRRWIARDQVMPGTSYLREVMRRGRNLVAMPGLVYRTSALATPAFDDNISMHYGDFVILMRMAETRPVALLVDALMQVRRHSEQASMGVRASEDLAIRGDMMRLYLGELAERQTVDHAFLDLLREDFDRSTFVVGLWGWWTAVDPDDASRCDEAVRGSRRGARLGPLLRLLDEVGVRRQLRKLSPLVRRVGNALKV